MEIKKEREFSSALFNERLDSVINGESNQSVAKKIGVQPGTLSKWRNYRDPAVPSLKGLLAISREYGCSIDYLVGNDKELNREEEPTGRQLCEMFLKMDKELDFHIEIIENINPKVSDYDPMKVSIQFAYQNPLAYSDADKFFFPLSHAEILCNFINEYAQLKKVPDLPTAIHDASIKYWLHNAEELEGTFITTGNPWTTDDTAPATDKDGD